MSTLMKSELCRVASFAKWMGSGISAIHLARAGFYYSGVADKVICYMCKVELDRWTSNDNVLERHKRQSPDCQLVNENKEDDLSTRTTHLGNPEVTNTYTSNATAGTGCEKQEEGNNSAFSESSARSHYSTKYVEHKLDRLTPDFNQLRDEELRLYTFFDWPQNAHANAQELARQGFFYIGSLDRVQCVFCRGCIGKWEPADIPAVEHKKHFPNCPFVQGLEAENIRKLRELSIEACPNQDSTANRTALSDTSISQLKPEVARPLISEQARSPAQSDSQASTCIKNPGYSDMSSRIKSFESRIIPRGQTSRTLAEAGFYYTGPGDKVMCFECGGNLKDWEPTDDPWEQHKLWYPNCPYLRTRRAASELPAHEPPVLQKMSTAVGSFRVEPREIKARMDTPTVNKILNMGYDRDLIRKAIEIRLTNTGDDFPNVETLLEAIFALEDGATSRTNSSHLSDSVSLPPVQMSSPSSASSSASTQIRIPNEGLEASFTGSELVAEGQSKSNGKRKKIKKKKTSTGITEQEQKEEREIRGNAEPKLRTLGLLGGGGEYKPDNRDLDEAEFVEENRRLREARTCKVCMDAEVNTVFLPCGHLVCCNRCSPLMRHCPICRTFVRGTVKTFLS